MYIKALAEQSDLYNFHSHTQFCDGRAPMENFARAAAEAGFKHYGFSPHSPIPIESPCNMSYQSVAEYLNEVDRLRDIYGHATKFYAGMEIDYLGSNWGAFLPYFQDMPLDYRISSVHFVPSRQGQPIDIDGRFESFKIKMDKYFGNDIRYVVDKFFDHTLEMLERGGFDIVGHIDKIAQNAALFENGIDNTPWFESRMAECLQLVKRKNYILEINTKSIATFGRTFPHSKWFPYIKSLGIDTIVNSDAHVPELINAGRLETINEFRAIGASEAKAATADF